MVLDGPLRRPKRIGNLPIAVPTAHQAQGLYLAPAEALRAVDRLELLRHLRGRSKNALRDGRAHQRTAGGHFANCAREVVE